MRYPRNGEYNTYSPYYIGIRDNEQTSYKDFSKYPHLPKDWEKMLTTEFFITFILFHRFCKSKEIICHLCYGDVKTSIKILSLVNDFIRSKNTPLPFIEGVLNNALYVFELKDSLEFIRLDTLFQLNDNKNTITKEKMDTEEKLSLFEYLCEERESHINLVLYILYSIGKAIEKYGNIYQYFQLNKLKLEWIQYFLIELKTDPIMKEDFKKNNTLIISQHTDLMNVIQESIIKKLGFESD